MFKVITYRYLYLIYLFTICTIRFNVLEAQHLNAVGALLTYYKVDINSSTCLSGGGCNFTIIGNQTFALGDGFTISSDLNFYGQGSDLMIVDTLTGFTTVYFDYPVGVPLLQGLASNTDNIFYAMAEPFISTDLYKIDVNNGTVVNLGATGHQCGGDLTFFDGELYFTNTQMGHSYVEVVKVDINNPGNSEVVTTYSSAYPTQGVTASNICNTLIITAGFVPNEMLYFLNLLDGTLTPICDVPGPPDELWYLSSKLELGSPTICNVAIDLDCDDSSGATDADYNSHDYDCLSNGVKISDNDIGMLYDAIISSMTIQITGFVPDAPNEILMMTGSVAGINVSGSGTDMITLTNAGGAKSTDFKDALRLIVYKNTAIPLTPGPRTVDVQFTTESGSMSNIATAFIDVISLPYVDVDLGPDLQKCDGQTATFNAGNPGAAYVWNTGSHAQSITTGNSGQYIVTVSNGIQCPTQDTVELDIIPVIHVSLTGGTEICDNEHANMTIVTDSPFPLDVEITPDPGSSFILTDVQGTYPFFDLPTVTTSYTITSVTPSQDACVAITNPTQVFYVYPTYVSSTSASICQGDSIWLGYYWEDQAGTYEILFNSEYGCDSTVTFTIDILPAVNISVTATTCLPAETGIFITHIDNPNGCDTVLTTTVTLLPSDTTHLTLSTCNLSNAGSTTLTLSNQSGCDSVIITTTSWIPPVDTTSLFQTTCDSLQLGVFQQILPAQSGCDSLIITTVGMALADTTYLFGVSCDSNEISVHISQYSNLAGCDSLVVTTITAGIPDTSFILKTSCDSASLGVFEDHFTNQIGCDSTVFTTVTFSAQDSTFIFNTTCDPGEVSMLISHYSNLFGCDSIVTETVSLLPSDQTFVNSTTCDSSQAGVFIHNLMNQNSCDSMVTETVAYAISHFIHIDASSCDIADTGIFVQTLTNQYGCDSTVTLTISLVPQDTTYIEHGTCDPNSVAIRISHYANLSGCDSVVIEETTLYNLPTLDITSSSNFNGFDISCYGESDGSVMANIAGTSPFDFIWNNGSKDQSITGLPAGSYTVTVTDANGCITSDEITLVQPEQFMIGFTITSPGCFDQHNGSIIANQTGGVEPVRYSIDGVNFQPSPSFNNLSGGTYTVTAFDANDCEVKEIIWINVPLMVNVELGDNQVVNAGDTFIINALVNVPFDSLASITWTGLNNPVCPTCLTQPVVPIITTTYSVTVTTEDGCSDEDELTLFLEKNTDVYVPNIFSPNGDNINDRLLISAGSNVEEIKEFFIFDRWGNVLYAADHFQPNDPMYAWDGKMKGRVLNPGVFVYRLLLRFKDGRIELRNGDITIVR